MAPEMAWLSPSRGQPGCGSSPTVHTCMSAQGRSLLRDCHGNNRLLRCDDASRMLDGLIVFLGPDAAIVVGCCVASLFFSFFLNHPTFILSLKTTTVPRTTIGAGHQGPACSLVLLRILEPVIYYAHFIGRLKEFVRSRRKTSNAVQMEVGTYCRWLADVDKNAAAQDRKAARSDRVQWLLRIYAHTYLERAVRKH